VDIRSIVSGATSDGKISQRVDSQARNMGGKFQSYERPDFDETRDSAEIGRDENGDGEGTGGEANVG